MRWRRRHAISWHCKRMDLEWMDLLRSCHRVYCVSLRVTFTTIFYSDGSAHGVQFGRGFWSSCMCAGIMLQEESLQWRLVPRWCHIAIFLPPSAVAWRDSLQGCGPQGFTWWGVPHVQTGICARVPEDPVVLGDLCSIIMQIHNDLCEVAIILATQLSNPCMTFGGFWCVIPLLHCPEM